MFLKSISRWFQSSIKLKLCFHSVLLPKDRYWTTDLSIGIGLYSVHISFLMMNKEKLFCFNKVCCIAFFIYSSCIVSCSSHRPSTTSNKDHFNFSRWWTLNSTMSYITLNYRYHPIMRYLLCSQLLKQIVIPHIPEINWCKWIH